MKKINTVNSTDFYRGKCLGSLNASYDPVFDFGMRANLNWRSEEICLPPRTEYIVFLVLRKINQKKTRVFNYNLLLFSDGAVKKSLPQEKFTKTKTNYWVSLSGSRSNFSCASSLKIEIFP